MEFLNGTGNLSQPKMKLTITQKTFLLVLATTLMTVAITFWLVFGSVSSGISSYFNARDKATIAPVVSFIESQYGKFGSWQFIKEAGPRLRHDLALTMQDEPIVDGPPHPPPYMAMHQPGPGGNFARPPRISSYQQEVLSRICLFDQNRQQLYGPTHLELGFEETPITISGKSVGYIKLVARAIETGGFESEFVENLRSNIYTIGGSILIFSLGAALLISHQITKPLKQIETGLKQLSEGEFTNRLDLKRSDELGDLASEINELAKALNKHEQSRMQWMADTSHELRTPIAILRAQIEAFQDGVQEVNSKTLGVIHSEIMALNGLVNQLYDLSRADLGKLSLRFKKFKPVGLIQECVESFEARYEEKNISLKTEFNDSYDAQVQCDPSMLKQVFSNLLENSLRYTDSGGKLKITTKIESEKFIIHYDDSEPGVPPELYGKLFERFFRVDSSRSRQLGGTGLGLAICKHILESHSGDITASQSPLGGLRMEIWIPLEGRS